MIFGGTLESTTKLSADDCIIYREIMNDNDIDTLQIDLNRLREWGVENVMKINPGQGKAVSSTRARVKDNYIICWATKEFRKRAAADI